MTMKKRRFNFSGAVAVVIALLVLAVFIPINLIVSYYDKGYDMTPAKKYTLNEKTVELINSNSDKQIDIYYLSLLKYFQDANATEFLPLYHTLTQLEDFDNVTLTCFEPDENAALANELDPEGILGLSRGDIFVKCNGVIRKVDHNKIFQQTSDGVPQYAGEELVAAAMSICTKGSLPTVYFLTGHGEKSIDENYSYYTNIIRSRNYDVQELNLDEMGAIPGNANIIYLAGPTKDITDREKELLLAYAENGGSMSFLLPPCDTEGRFYNIEAIMEQFGLILDYNIVTETEPINMLSDRDAKQSDNYFRVQYPVGSTYNEDFTEDLTTDVNMLVSDAGYIAGIANARSMTEIPDDSFPGAGYTERSSIIRNVPLSDGSYSTISRSMGGDDITAREADEMLSGIVLDMGYYSYNKITGGKLVVIGSTSIIDNNEVAESLSGTTTLATFSNTWLYDPDIEFGVGNKMTTYDYMTFKDAKEAKRTMVLVYVFPIVLALIGVAVWLKRRHS